MKMEYKESSIPKFVWDFVKKHTSSIIVAGILAMIIWGYMKKHQKESFTIIERLDVLLVEKINYISTDSKGAHYTWKIGANEEWNILVKNTNISGYKILDGGKHLLSDSDKKLVKKKLESLMVEKVSSVWKSFLDEKEKLEIEKEIKSFVDKVNQKALVKINLKEAPKRWLSEQLLNEQNNDLWKHLSTDKSSAKYFNKDSMDPTEGIFFVETDWLMKKAGNKTGGLGKEKRIRDAFEKGKKLPTPQYWLSDNNLGEGNHRVIVAKERGLKSVPVRVYWK